MVELLGSPRTICIIESCSSLYELASKTKLTITNCLLFFLVAPPLSSSAVATATPSFGLWHFDQTIVIPLARANTSTVVDRGNS